MYCNKLPKKEKVNERKKNFAKVIKYCNMIWPNLKYFLCYILFRFYAPLCFFCTVCQRFRMTFIKVQLNVLHKWKIYYCQIVWSFKKNKINWKQYIYCMYLIKKNWLKQRNKIYILLMEHQLKVKLQQSKAIYQNKNCYYIVYKNIHIYVQLPLHLPMHNQFLLKVIQFREEKKWKWNETQRNE